MIRPVLSVMLLAFGASTAMAQPYYRDRDRYDDRPRYYSDRCGAAKREAQQHYYAALRNQGRKGYLDAGEQRVQQQLQARYDACVAGYGRRRY